MDTRMKEHNYKKDKKRSFKINKICAVMQLNENNQKVQ